MIRGKCLSLSFFLQPEDLKKERGIQNVQFSSYGQCSYSLHHGPELSEDLCVFFVFNFAAINDKLLQQLVSSSMKKAQWLFFCYCRGITVKPQSKSHHF